MRPSVRFEIFKRDKFTCRYCGGKSPEAILEIDHVLPLTAGGTDEPDNLVTACFICNRGKAARLLTGISIPPESDLHEKAILLAEQELQIAEYNFWKAKQRAREDREIADLAQRWQVRWGGTYWQVSDVRAFLRALGYVELLEVLELVEDKTVSWAGSSKAYSAWRFFCGICHRRIEGRVRDAESDDP
jgi:hypothetical protein